MAQRNKIATKEKTETSVAFNFSDGETFEAKLADFPNELIGRLAVEGLSQKLGDSYSGMEDPAEARAVVERLYEALKQGNWSVRGESTGGGGKAASQLAKAVARVKGLEEADVVAKLATLDDDQKKALRKHPEIAPVIEQIKLEAQQEKLQKMQAAQPDGEAPSLDSVFAGG